MCRRPVVTHTFIGKGGLAFAVFAILVSEVALAADICAWPEERVRVFGPNRPRAVAVHEDLMVTLDTPGLSVWSISNPEYPQHIGTWTGPRGWRWPYDVDLHLDPRGYAIVIPGFTVIDVRDPANPQPLTAALTGDPLDWYDPWRGVAFQAELGAYMSGYLGNPKLLDLSRPAAPIWIESEWPGSGNLIATECAIADARLLVLNMFSDLRVYRVQDPTQPELISQIDLSPWIPFPAYWHLRAEGDLALLIDSIGTNSGFPLTVLAVDLTDELNPSVYEVSDKLDWGLVSHLVFDDSTVFVDMLPPGFGSDHATIQGVSFENPADPLPMIKSDQSDGGDIAVNSTTVISVDSRTIRTFQRSDLQLVQQLDVAGFVDEIAVDGALAVVAADESGIVTVDLDANGEPAVLAQFDLGGDVEDVELAGDVAYALNYSDSLHCIDVGDPKNPVSLSRTPVLPGSLEIAQEGPWLVVGVPSYGSTAQVEIWDVSDPSGPVKNATLTLCGTSRNYVDVEIRDGIAYAVSGGSLSTIDLNGRNGPTILDCLMISADSYEDFRSVSLLSSHAVIGSSRQSASGFVVVDVSDPNNLVEVHRIGDRATHDLSSVGSLAAATTILTVELVDLFDPQNPVFQPVAQPLRGADAGTMTPDSWFVPGGSSFEVFSFDCVQPTADFGWSGTGLAAYFDNRGRGDFSEVLWDFGDGAQSQERDPIHIFPDVGTYQVTLTLMNNYGSDSVVHEVLVGAALTIFRDGFEMGDTSEWSGTIQ